MEKMKGMSELISDMTDRIEERHGLLMTTITEKDEAFVLDIITMHMNIMVIVIAKGVTFDVIDEGGRFLHLKSIKEVERIVENIIIKKDKKERLRCVVGEKEMNTERFLFPIFGGFFERQNMKKIKEELKKDYTEKEIVKESLRIMENRVEVGEGSGNGSELYPAVWFCFLNHSYTFRYETCQKENSKQEAKEWLHSQGYKNIRPM